MGTITYNIPVAGSTLNSLADPEISTALQTLLTLVNGNIDTNNLSPTAGIVASQLRSVFPSGLLSARPAAASAGETFYYATDSGLLYWSNGTAWTSVATPAGAGSWSNLTLGTSVLTSSHGSTPAGRLEGTDVARLRGAFSTSGSISAGATIATVPTPLRPPNTVGLVLGGAYLNPNVIQAEVSTLGAITSNTALGLNTEFSFDGCTYTLT